MKSLTKVLVEGILSALLAATLTGCCVLQDGAECIKKSFRGCQYAPLNQNVCPTNYLGRSQISYEHFKF
jgi:hypothetical protein